MRNLLSKTSTLLASRRFFIGLMVFFVVEALWIAFSAAYPMAFDEDFHFGLIKMYSHYWLPFLQGQPVGADAFGAVARDPSYLYHYLMSFPYRFLTLFVHSESAQILVLRTMNVAMFAGSLVLFRRVMLRVTRSQAFTNVSIAIFILIPIVPQLAAHINYDNLLMILVAWSCLLTFEIGEHLAARRINLKAIATLFTVCMLASLVKYPYLPMFAAAVVYLAWQLHKHFWRQRIFKAEVAKSWRSLSVWWRVGLIAMLVISGGLFFQRFGINTLRYHTPVPSCDQVLSVDHCSAYGPWNRNYQLEATKGDFNRNPIVYTVEWFYGLWRRMFFAINGPTHGYTNYQPLPLPAAAAIGLGVVVLVATIKYRDRIFARHPEATFLLMTIVFYCGALWLDDYQQYLETGQPVAINGRYLLPVLLLAAAMVGRGLHILFTNKQRPWLKPAVATLVLVLFLQGGGVFTFILRSDESWYWTSNAVNHVNDAARKVISPFIVKNAKKYE